MPDSLEPLLEECEEQEQYERMAALALFHGDLPKAISVRTVAPHEASFLAHAVHGSTCHKSNVAPAATSCAGD